MLEILNWTINIRIMLIEFRTTIYLENFHQLLVEVRWGEGGHKGDKIFFAFQDELNHFKHKIKSVIMTS